MKTTDPQDELFDVIDMDGNPTGVAKPRGLIHRDGDWHRSLHIWVYGVDEIGEPFVLFQRRSGTKDTWPGALDVAVGGHIRAGEGLAETVREADEELGLDLKLADLTTIGRRFASWQGQGVIDRELNEVFALRSDQPLEEYRLHPVEVAGIVRINLEDCRRLFAGEIQAVPATEFRPGSTSIEQGLIDIEVRLDSFPEIRDGYNLAAVKAISFLVGVRMHVRTSLPFLIRPPKV